MLVQELLPFDFFLRAKLAAVDALAAFALFAPAFAAFQNPRPKWIRGALDWPRLVGKAALRPPQDAIVIVLFQKGQGFFVSVILNPTAVFFNKGLFADFKALGKSCQIFFGEINDAGRNSAAVRTAAAFKGKSVFVKAIIVRQNSNFKF